jgi:hypothetical protein
MNIEVPAHLELLRRWIKAAVAARPPGYDLSGTAATPFAARTATLTALTPTAAPRALRAAALSALAAAAPHAAATAAAPRALRAAALSATALATASHAAATAAATPRALRAAALAAASHAAATAATPRALRATAPAAATPHAATTCPSTSSHDEPPEIGKPRHGEHNRARRHGRPLRERWSFRGKRAGARASADVARDRCQHLDDGVRELLHGVAFV